jgi:uncharacterized protein (DUF983 family)
LSKSSSYNALLHQRCPRCRQGDVFEYPSTQLSKFAVMHKNCPICNQNYEPEPGFYFGAMFVAYGLIIAMVFILWLTLFFVFDDPPFSVYIIVIVIFNVLLLPLLFRYSRLIFLYAFGGIRYDSQILNKEK